VIAVDTVVRLLTTVLPMVYLLAVVAYIFDFVSFHPAAARTARRLLNAALAMHAVQLGLRGVLYLHVPLATRGEVLGTVAFAIACVYLLVERRTQVERTGAFVVGAVLILQTLSSAFVEPVTQIPAILRSPLFGIHAGSAVLGYAAFGLSAVYGVLSLLLHRALKRRRFGIIFERLPSLDVLTRMSLSAAAVGSVFLGVAITLGMSWASLEFPGFLTDPKVVMTVAVWLAYVAVLFAHHRLRWSRRRAIGLSLVAFVLLIASALATVFGLPSFHTFE
jgi:ABC-type uncharacterized transport system permease subunit